MLKSILHSLFASVLVLPVVGCHDSGIEPDTGDQSSSQAQRAGDYKSLIDKLRAQKAVVEPGDEISQPFFSVKGRVIKIDGEDVQVFEYKTAGDAEKEADTVDPSGGSVGTTMLHWIATPHFYRSGKLIALYVGENAAVIKALEAALGPQFAGG